MTWAPTGPDEPLHAGTRRSTEQPPGKRLLQALPPCSICSGQADETAPQTTWALTGANGPLKCPYRDRIQHSAHAQARLAAVPYRRHVAEQLAVSQQPDPADTGGSNKRQSGQTCAAPHQSVPASMEGSTWHILNPRSTDGQLREVPDPAAALSMWSGSLPMLKRKQQLFVSRDTRMQDGRQPCAF